MTVNPDWMAALSEMVPVDRDTLTSLGGPRLVLCDLPAILQRLLNRKRLFDMTGKRVDRPDA